MYNPREVAESKGLVVREASLSLSYGYLKKEERLIVVDKNLPENKKQEVIAHELKHYDYPYANKTTFHCYRDVVFYNAHEKFIDRRAAEDLIPLGDLKDFLKENPEAEIWDIADFFGITERYVHIRFESLKNKGVM